MKKLLTIILLFFSITLYSQNYIGAFKYEVELNKGIPITSDKIDENNNLIGTTYINDLYIEKYLYLDDFCIGYSIEAGYDQLTNIIKLLNRDYEKVKNEWFYYKKDYKIIASIIHKENTFKTLFVIEFYE